MKISNDEDFQNKYFFLCVVSVIFNKSTNDKTQETKAKKSHK